jgi:hypothetical protein
MDVQCRNLLQEMIMSGDVLKQAGFSGRGKTFHRRINDLVQLVNFQKSNFSSEQYINVGIWPLALGEPSGMMEHKFPIRGRIEDFINDSRDPTEEIARLIQELNGPLSDVNGLRSARKMGRLSNIYLSAEARALVSAED